MGWFTKVLLHKQLRNKQTKLKRCDYCNKTKPKYWVNSGGLVERNVAKFPNGTWKCRDCAFKGRV
jgi:uncharacterized protein with PIN domain